MTRAARRLRGERGATVLEFALVLPIFLAVAGLVLFAGWMGAAKTILNRGAQQGARYAAIPVSADLRTYPSQAQVASAVDTATPLLTPTSVTVASGAGGAARLAPLTVTVTYQVPNPVYALFAPLRAFGWGAISPTITLTSRAEVRRE